MSFTKIQCSKCGKVLPHNPSNLGPGDKAICPNCNWVGTITSAQTMLPQYHVERVVVSVCDICGERFFDASEEMVQSHLMKEHGSATMPHTF